MKPLSELCAHVILEDETVSTKYKVDILERLRHLSKKRSEAFEEEIGCWQERSQHVRQVDDIQEGKENEAKEPSSEHEDGDEEEDAVIEAETKTKEEKMDSDFESDSESDSDRRKKKIQEELMKRKSSSKALQNKFVWKQKLNVLNRRVIALDRERLSFLQRSSVQAAFKELERYDVDLGKSYISEKDQLLDRLQRCKWACHKLRSCVDELGSGDKYLHKIKSLMEAAQGEIAITKSNQKKKYEKLVDEEQFLFREVEYLAAKFRDEEKNDKAKSKRRKADNKAARQNKTTTSNGSHTKNKAKLGFHDDSALKEQIADIDEEMAELGGSRGKWDDRDHALFLRYISRFKLSTRQFDLVVVGGGRDDSVIQKFVDKVAESVPMHDEQSVWEHLEWYGKYNSLLIQKRDLVKEWKQSKPNKAKSRDVVNDENESNRKNVTEEKVEDEDRKKKRLLEERKERNARRKSVQEWRRNKVQEEETKRKEVELLKKLKLQRQAEEYKKRKIEREKLALLKLENEAFKAQQVKNRKAQERKEVLERQKASKKVIHKRQERDKSIALKRRQAALVAKEKLKTRQERISCLKVTPKISNDVKRDPNRLTRPTKSLQSKIITPSDLDEISDSRYRRGAHQSVVASSAGAERRDLGYGIGVGMVSGRRQASWRSSHY